jgi:predicted dehydrogenase
MLRVGIVGIGFMGMIHYLAYRKAKGAKVAAVCSRDPKKRAGDWRGIRGNFGPPGEVMDLKGVRAYERLEEVLADPAIDMVDLCLPPGDHARAAIAALKAGKHVLCEKPITLAAADARRMLAAAAAAKRRLLVAHVLPFFPEWAFAWQAASSGKYGRFLGGQFKRIISDPTWLPNFYDPRAVGGPMIDLHVHDAHFIRIVAGMPSSVFTSGRLRGEVAEFFTSQFQFPDRTLHVTATCGAIHQQGRSFTHGFEMHLERATLLFEFAVLDGQPTTIMPLTVLAADGKVLRPKLRPADPIDGFAKELSEAARAIETGEPSALLDGRLAADALAMCEAQTASLIHGKTARIR